MREAPALETPLRERAYATVTVLLLSILCGSIAYGTGFGSSLLAYGSIVPAVAALIVFLWKSKTVSVTSSETAGARLDPVHDVGHPGAVSLQADGIVDIRLAKRLEDITRQLQRRYTGAQRPPAPADLEIVRFLGQGGQGAAYACISTSGELLVMKQVALQRARTPKEIDQIMDEVSNTCKFAALACPARPLARTHDCLWWFQCASTTRISCACAPLTPPARTT
jgi:hypothetical protein